MRKLILSTAVLLVIQLALVVAGHLGSRTTMSAAPESPFLEIASEAVTALEIDGGPGRYLRLAKQDGRWLLPDLADAPADQRQVASLLDKLTALKQGFVVASSAEAAKRFKVADDHYERRLVVQNNDRVIAEFLTGTSPAFRQVHARKIGSSDIVAVNLASYDLETAADSWLDKQALQVADTDLAGLDIADLSLRRETNEGKETKVSWNLADTTAGTLDQTAADELAEAISRLYVIGVVEAKDRATLDFDQPALAFTVHTVDNRELRFSFAALDETFFAVQRSDSGIVYTISNAEVENLQRFSRERLLGIQPEPAAAGGPAGASGSQRAAEASAVPLAPEGTDPGN